MSKAHLLGFQAASRILAVMCAIFKHFTEVEPSSDEPMLLVAVEQNTVQPQPMEQIKHVQRLTALTKLS
jgi:hypothetical protein